MPQLGLLGDLLTLIGLGVVVVLLFHRLRLPPIVGFLVTGVLCGPYGFGLIRNVHDVEGMAEVGVILLLFTVGIELSVEQLTRLRTMLLVGGGLQVGLTVAATAALSRVIGQPWHVGIFLGMLVALSSTAIVLRLLAERGEIDSPHGQSALAILIFQDLCIVPMVLLTPVLAGRAGSLASTGWVVLKAVAFIGAAIAAARYVVPRVLHQVVATRRREVFLLTIILLCLGTAWLSAQVGLSLALGAFIAGIVVSESEYSHQALGEMLPLREVFNSLFFVSIGMLFDVRTVLRDPLVVLGGLAAVLVVKALIAVGVTFGLGQSLRASVLAGVAIAQIGEFSFVLSKTGLEVGLLDERLNQLFLAVAVVTLTVSPALMGLTPPIAGFLERRTPSRFALGRLPRDPTPTHTPLTDHVIIVGYGLNGRNVARVLGRAGIPFTVIDTNPETVRAERRRNRPIIFGDATRQEILSHAGVERARVLVIAISDPLATRGAVVLARRMNPALHIIVRSRYVYEVEPLRALGTDEVVPEEFETSVEIFSRVLGRYLLPRDVIERMIADVRRDSYQALRTVSDVHTPAVGVERLFAELAIETYRAEEGSAVAGRTLTEANLRKGFGVTVIAIQHRGGEMTANPGGADRIDPGDAALLLGRPEALTAAAASFRRSPEGAA